MTDSDVREKPADQVKEDRRRSALVKSSSGLAPYGTPEELAEMVGRMRYMIVGGDKLTDNQIWGLAQASFVLDLNPFAKEICWLKDGPFPQIRGIRRKGREQLQELYGPTGRPNLDFIQITDPVERDQYLIPDGALAYKCIGMVPAKRTHHTEDAQRLALALFGDGQRPPDSHKIVLDAIGPMPVAIGIGYITKEEMDQKDNPRWWHVCKDEEGNSVRERNTEKIKDKWQCVLRGHDPCPVCERESWAGVNKYPHTQCAMKRSEAHMWYQESDLPFPKVITSSGEGFADFGDDNDDFVSEVIEGQFRYLDDDRPTYRGHQIPDGLLAYPEDFELWKQAIDDDELAKTEGRKPVSGDLYKPKHGDPYKKKPAATEQATLPLNGRTPDEVKKQVIAWTKSKEFSGTRKNEQLVKQAAIMLNECFANQPSKDRETNRKRVTLFLYGQTSLNDLTGAQLRATLKLIDAKEVGEGEKKKWVPNPIRLQEIRRIAKEVAEG